MANSYAHPFAAQCEQCGTSLDFEVWVIVDTEERPDLVTKLRAGTLHDLVCSNCHSFVGRPNAPLLCYRPHAEPHLLFSPAEATTDLEDRQEAALLIALLRERLAGAWDEGWLTNGLKRVPRDEVPSWLGGPVDAPPPAASTIAAPAASTIAAPAASTIAAPAASAIAAPAASAIAAPAPPNIPPARLAELGQTMLAFINAAGPAEMQRIVESHPEMLTDDMNAVLAAFGQAQTAPQLQQVIEAYRALLRRCRKIGIGPAFAERFGRATGSPDLELIQLLREINLPGDAHRHVELCRRALARVSREQAPELWAGLQGMLATALFADAEGDLAENLEQALAALGRALEVFSPERVPGDWAAAQNNLGNVYCRRMQGDRAENLEQAIAAYGCALQVRTRVGSPRDWALTTQSLGNAYLMRIRGDRADNVEQAMAAFDQALEVATREALPQMWAGLMVDVGSAYLARIRGERAENLERALDAYQQALQVRTKEAAPLDWAGAMLNLGNAYVERTRGDRAENLEQAIVAYAEAAEVYSRQKMPVEWALALNNAGAASRNRVRGDRGENLERAIDAYKRALQVRTRPARPDEWAETMTNLGHVYRERIQGDRAENLELAITAYQLALQVRTDAARPDEWALTQFSLGNAYRERIQGDGAANLAQAIAAYQQALQVYGLDQFPSRHALVQRGLARAYAQSGQWPEAAGAYQAALDAGDALYGAAATPEARQAELRNSLGLAGGLAHALSQCAGQDSEALGRGVLALERHRARWLSEALALQGDRPASATDAAWQGFLSTSAQVRELQVLAQLREGAPGKPDFLTLTRNLREARGALEQAVEAVRAQAPDFMPEPELDEVFAAAKATGAPLAYLALTPEGGLALVVTPGNVAAVPLPQLTDTAVADWLGGRPGVTPPGGYLGAYRRWVQTPTREMQQAWFDVLDQLTRWLWDAAMGPLARHLQPVPDATKPVAVTLIASGYLEMLPLHAAWTEAADTPAGRLYAIDLLTLRYAPNARALAAAQGRAARAVLDGVLTIDNPDGSLQFAAEEVAAALSHFPEGRATRLAGGQATRAAVLQELPCHAVLHLSTHGVAGWDHPLDSRLRLARGEQLTLRDLLALDLAPARMAVLSACETGVPGVDLPDEVIGLPAGLLQAGVAGVAATLWSVNDLSTAMLTEHFYRLWQHDGLTPAAALRAAQRWLRDTTNAEKRAYFATHVPQWAGDSGEMTPTDFYVNEKLGDLAARSFASPFWWAAFAITGV